MARSSKILLLVPLVMLLAVLLVAMVGWSGAAAVDPWEHLPRGTSKTNHAGLFEETSLADGPAVTRACLTCHPESARQVMRTSHWNWLGDPETVPGHEKPMRIGKRNLMNNFCISIEGNWPTCTRCHAGYGWEDADYDFGREENVDCLICHDQSGQYAKALAGLPAKGVDLLAAAKSVGRPSRDNCGWCHFNGGGGDAVKHGDLDGSLSKPVERVDVHMGRHDFQCVDCHRTRDHHIPGKMMSVSTSATIEFSCADCHQMAPHRVERLNLHSAALSCQACHLPEVARTVPTKVAWDWSTAGQDIDVDDPHRYLKIKGSFVYARRLVPEYRWFNGNVLRYIKGDRIDPAAVTHITYPQGDIRDPAARIWPFKVHRAKQPYDKEHLHLIVPKTWGEGGYWTAFDWQKAAELGAEAAGLPFSGELGFAETDMYWTLTHMIAPKERALQCTDCHSQDGRMNWQALGYEADPALVGGRGSRRYLAGSPERGHP